MLSMMRKILAILEEDPSLPPPALNPPPSDPTSPPSNPLPRGPEDKRLNMNTSGLRIPVTDFETLKALVKEVCACTVDPLDPEVHKTQLNDHLAEATAFLGVMMLIFSYADSGSVVINRLFFSYRALNTVLFKITGQVYRCNWIHSEWNFEVRREESTLLVGRCLGLYKLLQLLDVERTQLERQQQARVMNTQSSSLA